MHTNREKSKRTFELSQENYILKVLNGFNVYNIKQRETSMGPHFKQSKE